jgi:hypothetical protein
MIKAYIHSGENISPEYKKLLKDKGEIFNG